jgi:tyrosyl-tRNA synthetase
MNIVDVLKERGLVEDMTAADLHKVLEKPVRLYLGIDPTANSLHLGHLVGVMLLGWFQKAGHGCVGLVGGATGLIGDPGGKKKERPLLDRAQVESNVRGIRALLDRLVEAKLVNNIDWFGKMDLITFLRDVGKNFRLGPMLGKEMVRTRLASDEGMSFTEFSYSLLQAWDFLHLYEHEGVTLQIGGSDQWGNITAGTELIRRLKGGQAYGLTFPLLTRSDGKKFGKTEEGAVWLTEERTSPYEFYQYLVRVPDADVTKLMRMLTYIEMDEVRDWEARMKQESYEPHSAQRRLAEWLTQHIHGDEGLAKAQKVTESVRPGGEAHLDAGTLEALAGDMLSATLPRDRVVNQPLLDLLAQIKLVASKGEGRRLVRQGGVYLNNRPISDEGRTIDENDLVEGRLLLIGVGKRKKMLLRIGEES